MPGSEVTSCVNLISKKLHATTVASPLVMGVLNITPDSFYATSRMENLDILLFTAEEMLAEGVDIFDIGGESTRPYATEISLDEELARVCPAIEGLRERFAIPVSIDTFKPKVMQAAVDAGAAMINDIYALTKPGALTTAAKLDVPVCLMHMQNTPQTMQVAPNYKNVIAEINSFLVARVESAVAAGISKHNIIVDPGFGFGKTLQHQLSMLKHIKEFQKVGQSILIGLSRKSMFGKLLNKEVDDRLSATLAATIFAAQSTDISIIRTHDVGATKDAIRVLSAIVGGK